MTFLWKETFHRDGQQFHQYWQNRLITSLQINKNDYLGCVMGDILIMGKIVIFIPGLTLIMGKIVIFIPGLLTPCCFSIQYAAFKIKVRFVDSESRLCVNSGATCQDYVSEWSNMSRLCVNSGATCQDYVSIVEQHVKTMCQ